jgi:hypothetical protein
LHKLKIGQSVYQHNRIIRYEDFIRHQLSIPVPKYKQFPSVTPSWDNTARRKKDMFILRDSSPALYEHWLKEVVRKFEPYSPEENFVFINAWNEWGEGNHLEPCAKWGRGYLEATQRVFQHG